MRWRLAFVAAFFLLSLLKVSRHEIWADEAEYWAEARDSHSLKELYVNSVYVGQPLTTFFPFYAVSRFTRSPFAMQVVNVVEMTAAIAVIAFAAPWSLQTTALFSIGYFPFFEYGTISRHYALPMFFGLLFCALYKRAGRLSFGAAGAAAGLTLASFHGVILALALLAALVLTWLLERRRLPRSEVLGCLLVLACMAFAIATAVPPSDSITLKPWIRSVDGWSVLKNGIEPMWTAFAPLPPLSPPWWNHNLLDHWPDIRFALGLGLMATAFWTLRSSRLAMLWLALATLGLQTFAALQWGGFARHAGLLFVAFVMCYWLAGGGSRLFPLLLLLQVPGGLWLSYMDLIAPFSPSVATADYLRQRGFIDLPMLGHKEFIVTPVFTLLDRRYYSPQRGGWVTHPEFSSRMRRSGIEDVRATARRLRRRFKKDVVLVVNVKLPPGPRLKFETCFTEEFVGQHFCIYRMRADNRPMAASAASP